MARTKYKCGGKGRYGKPGNKTCTMCGRVHPSGRRKPSNWESCSEVAARRKNAK